MKREELIEAIFANMQQMHRTGTSKFHALMGRQDISASQMELLLTVKHRQRLSVKEIAAQMRLTPGAVTQMLEGLVASGYLERHEDARDRRVTNVSLAEGGKQKLHELWEQRKQLVRKVMETLDDQELAVMLRAQEKMFQHIEALAADAEKIK
ncbi:MAG: MarR family transcriptional regulator [Candidatus Saccharibacteria bacterium]